MADVLVILSGCGVQDGAEIHESVLTLLHLDRHGARVTCAAPDGDQVRVVNHLTGEPANETRNMRVEAARIARGDIADLAALNGADFDAIVLPGGFGAATNLCNFATAGADCEVHPEVARVLREAKEAGKTLGFACIAPTIAARLFPGAKLTIGSDAGTASALEAMGASHQARPTEDVCIDEQQRIVTTPAYMTARSIREVDAGIGKMVDRVLEMAG